jgi:hypothetical protein
MASAQEQSNAKNENNIKEEEHHTSSQIPELTRKCAALLISLSPVHKNGSEDMKQYTIQIAKLLCNVINAKDDIILTELHEALEHVLIAYMPDILSIMTGTLDESQYARRNDLLEHVNNMVGDQMKHADKLEQAKSIMMNVYAI